MRRTVGMCVMNSDSGGWSVVVVVGRWVRVGDVLKLVDTPVVVAVDVVDVDIDVTCAGADAVAVPEVTVVVDSCSEVSSSSSLAVPARFFIAKDRGSVVGPRPISLLLRNAVECAVVRVRGPPLRSRCELEVPIASLGTGISSAGP